MEVSKKIKHLNPNSKQYWAIFSFVIFTVPSIVPRRCTKRPIQLVSIPWLGVQWGIERNFDLLLLLPCNGASCLP